jgi:hypothetical protein
VHKIIKFILIKVTIIRKNFLKIWKVAYYFLYFIEIYTCVELDKEFDASSSFPLPSELFPSLFS